MKKSLIFMSVVMASFSSAYAMTDAELQKAMRAEVEPHIFTIKKPRLFFHWVDASDITPKGQYDQAFPSNSTQFTDYVEKEGKKVVNQRSDRDQDIAGPGMYLASDPLVSRDYGGEKRFGLVVGKINTKARVLPGGYNMSFSKEVVSEFEKRGCRIVANVLQLLDTADANCTKLKQLLVGKDASFIDGRLYSWSSQARYLPGCNYNAEDETTINAEDSIFFPLETFVAYNKNLFSEIVGFTHKSSVYAGSSFANNILSYLKTLDANGLSLRLKLISDEQRRDPKIPLMNQTDLANFTKNNIFGCR